MLDIIYPRYKKCEPCQCENLPKYNRPYVAFEAAVAPTKGIHTVVHTFCIYYSVRVCS